MKLNDLKIIVSGGAQGMGRHFAVRLVEAGASVAIGDVNEAGLPETIAEAKAIVNHEARAPEGRSGAGKIFSFKVDVSKEDEIAAFVAFAHEKMGGLNGLINNAGILRDGLLVKKDRETDRKSTRLNSSH